ncbi:MAG: hypothetical protein BWY93_01960 [Euryarchaeota archaeon ADurb.BinA087]|nr:MAG: hypothetical protein BWY93_01960 [Euryarchaeota archaeon ADurb.BinA087]
MIFSRRIGKFFQVSCGTFLNDTIGIETRFCLDLHQVFIKIGDHLLEVQAKFRGIGGVFHHTGSVDDIQIHLAPHLLFELGEIYQ